MTNTTITIKPGDNLNWLVDQIQQDKITRIESTPPVNLRLTASAAIEHLSRFCLLEHEAIALLFGMIPHSTETADDFSCMEPGDNAVVRRLLADKKAGKLTFPMRMEEFIAYVTPWRHELSDELACALDMHDGKVDDGSTIKERKASATAALAEVKRTMSEAISTLEAVGVKCHPTLPGTKVHYCEYIRSHSARLKGLADTSLHDYFKQCGFRWKQGGGPRQVIEQKIRCALLVPANETPPTCAPVVVKAVPFDPFQLFHTNVKT